MTEQPSPDDEWREPVLFIQEPEGAIRCNSCDPSNDWIDVDPEVHAREVHGADVLTVVHPDDV
ncbi:MAG: hypothetical protein JWO67_6495 [Streptosporangiaceae bacterium]|nr:hypothetical protein [Streptosporangiaceae bacterium]